MNVKIHANEIKIVPVSSLKQRPGNRNRHGQDQIERLAEIYVHQGFRSPIVVSNLSGHVVCGAGRLLAAIRAGLKEVPVIYQDFDSEESEYAHHIADNGLNNWSELDFKGINADIGELGPDFDISLLGIKDFHVDASEKPKKEKKSKNCPHCGETI